MRRVIVIRWLFFGTLFALLVAYIREKIENKVHTKKELEKLIPFNLIDTLSVNYQENWKDIINLFAKNNPFKKSTKEVGIISIGDENNLICDSILEQLVKFCNDKSFSIINEFSKIQTTQEQILLISISKFSQYELDIFLKKLQIEESSIVGWFLLEK